MMGSDARDMMGLPSAGQSKPAPAKVPKPKFKGLTGMSREVLDLNYEGAPPISIVAPKFKDKPKLPFKPRQWEEAPFGNSARKDGLVLRHWRRKGDISSLAGLPVTPADSNAASEMDQDDKSTNTMSDSHFAKYNVRVEKLHYTPEQYVTHLSSDDWTKEETDYLIDLATDYDLRWIIIGDRYDYRPTEQTQDLTDSTALVSSVNSRSIEDLKSRYYSVAAKIMVLHNPLSGMSSSEFDIYEKMTKYDPARETQRKKYAEQLLQRTDEEKYEEEMLLKELSRIVMDQEKLFNERKSLYERLEAPPTTTRDSYSTTMYQSSQGLTQLMQNLLSQNKTRELEKKEKRRSVVGPGDTTEIHNMDRNQRHSIGGAQEKRNTLPTGPNLRQISRTDREKYGVSYPQERLTGGVQFRHERVTKAGQAKSGAQTTKIGQALTELNIPPRLLMPTKRVVTEYERLIEGIKTLLEARKVCEKLDGEVRVWLAQKEQKEKKERGEEIGEEEAKAVEAKTDDAETEGQDEEGFSTAQRQSIEAQESEDEGRKESEGSSAEEESEMIEDESQSEIQRDGDSKFHGEEIEEDGNEDQEDEEAADDDDQEAEGESANDEASAIGDLDVTIDDNGNVEADDQQEDEEEGDDEEGEAEPGEDDEDTNETSIRANAASIPANRNMRKRSASVMSTVSDKSAKRQRK